MVGYLGTLEGLGCNLCILGIGFVISVLTYLFKKALMGEIKWKD